MAWTGNRVGDEKRSDSGDTLCISDTELTGFAIG